MNIVAFTTSTDTGSVAVFSGEKLTANVSWTRQTQSSEALTSKIKAALMKAKLKPRDLHLIAVDKGPGSFTGCRLAANVAKTFAYTLQLPVFAVSSLDIIARAAAEKSAGKTICVLDAHKSLLYCREFDSGSPISNVGALPLEIVVEKVGAGTLVAGDIPAWALPDLKARIKSVKAKLGAGTLKAPQAKALVKMAAAARPQDYISWSELEPAYVRVPDALERLSQSFR